MTRSPAWCVQCDCHCESTDQSCARYSQHPADEDLANLLPIQTLDIAVRDCDSNNGAGDALCRGDGQTKLRSEEDSDGGSKLHAEPACRRVLGDAVAKVAHDVVPVGT